MTLSQNNNKRFPGLLTAGIICVNILLYELNYE